MIFNLVTKEVSNILLLVIFCILKILNKVVWEAKSLVTNNFLEVAFEKY